MKQGEEAISLSTLFNLFHQSLHFLLLMYQIITPARLANSFLHFSGMVGITFLDLLLDIFIGCSLTSVYGKDNLPMVINTIKMMITLAYSTMGHLHVSLIKFIYDFLLLQISNVQWLRGFSELRQRGNLPWAPYIRSPSKA